jgi:hypothetical protein
VTPAQIRDATLPGVGPFGRSYVRRMLALLADQVAGLEAELAAARHTVRLREAEIEQRRYGVELPGGRYDQLLDAEVLRRQIEAQRLCDDLILAATEQAAEIVDAARRQALS